MFAAHKSPEWAWHQSGKTFNQIITACSQHINHKNEWVWNDHGVFAAHKSWEVQMSNHGMFAAHKLLKWQVWDDYGMLAAYQWTQHLIEMYFMRVFREMVKTSWSRDSMLLKDLLESRHHHRIYINKRKRKRGFQCLFGLIRRVSAIERLT